MVSPTGLSNSHTMRPLKSVMSRRRFWLSAMSSLGAESVEGTGEGVGVGAGAGGFDPYRTTFGMSENRLGLTIVGMVLGTLALAGLIAFMATR